MKRSQVTFSVDLNIISVERFYTPLNKYELFYQSWDYRRFEVDLIEEEIEIEESLDELRVIFDEVKAELLSKHCTNNNTAPGACVRFADNNSIITVERINESLHEELFYRKEDYTRFRTDYSEELFEIEMCLEKARDTFDKVKIELMSKHRKKINAVKVTFADNPSVITVDRIDDSLHEELYYQSRDYRRFEIDDIKEQLVTLRREIANE